MKDKRTILLLLVTLVAAACNNSHATPNTLVPAISPGATRVIELQVIPKKLRTGMRATMVGLGFEKGEIVAFYLIRPDGTKISEGETTANTNGGAAYEIDVLDDWQPGQYMAHVISKKNPSRGAQQRVDLSRR
jgi:hypothetical protein